MGPGDSFHLRAHFSAKRNPTGKMEVERPRHSRELSKMEKSGRNLRNSLSQTPQPYRSACSSVRCISSRSISVKTDPPIVLVPGWAISGVR